MDQTDPSVPGRRHHAPTHLPDVSTLPGASPPTTGPPAARAAAPTRAPLGACRGQRTRSSSPSSRHRRCHVFTDSGDLAWVSCPAPPPLLAFPRGALRAQDPGFGATEKGPGQAVALRVQETALCLFSPSSHAPTVHKRTGRYPPRSSVTGCSLVFSVWVVNRLQISSAV